MREEERGVEREEASGDGLGMDLVDVCNSFAGSFESKKCKVGCFSYHSVLSAEELNP